MRESTIERIVCKYARDRGCRVIKNSMPGHRGIPDRLILGNDKRTLWLELKRPGEEPTPLQYKWLSWLKQRGHAAEWTDNAATGIKLIREHVLGESNGNEQAREALPVER